MATQCSLRFRTHDGTCSNPTNPTWASTNRPHFSYFRGHTSETVTGEDRNSSRLISNAVSTQDEENIPNRRKLSDFLTSFGQFLDHDYALTPLTDVEFPIEIPEDDELRNEEGGELEFRRSERGIIAGTTDSERALNSLTSVIDLSTVYGSDDARNRALRTLVDGKLKTGPQNLLPLNSMGLMNVPSRSSAFFVAGDVRAGEHPTLTTIHTLFLREHNRIVDEIRRIPFLARLSDELVYQFARTVNIAQFQRIVYEEFLPAIMGRRFPRYRGFRRLLDPTISNTFSTAAYRIGHTLVRNTVTRKGRGNTVLKPLQMTELFFRPASTFSNELMDEVIRGTVSTPAQEIDTKVVDTLRNFLFKQIEEEEGIDLIAINLQRGRDHALPAYNDIRERFGIRRAVTFADITRDRETQERLAYAYESPDKIDAWIGLMAEDHLPGASMGRTMFALWTVEFSRLRDGDQFFYKNSRVVRVLRPLRRLETVRNLFRSRSLMRDIILRNTAITASELPNPVSVFMTR